MVKLAIRLADLQLRAAVYPTKRDESLDKAQWNGYLQAWNVVEVEEGFLVDYVKRISCLQLILENNKAQKQPVLSFIRYICELNTMP